MNISFIIIQFIGVVAWLLLVYSYYRKDTNEILSIHIIAACLYAIHYYYLGAYSAVVICLFEALRDYGYYKTDIDRYIYIGSLPIYVLIGIFNFKTIVDTLPIISSLIDGYVLTKHKKIVVLGAILSYLLWVIYNINVKSYSGIITDGILVLSNLSILIFNKGLFKNKDIRKK